MASEYQSLMDAVEGMDIDDEEKGRQKAQISSAFGQPIELQSPAGMEPLDVGLGDVTQPPPAEPIGLQAPAGMTPVIPGAAYPGGGLPPTVPRPGPAGVPLPGPAEAAPPGEDPDIMAAREKAARDAQLVAQMGQAAPAQQLAMSQTSQMPQIGRGPAGQRIMRTAADIRKYGEQAAGAIKEKAEAQNQAYLEMASTQLAREQMITEHNEARRQRFAEHQKAIETRQAEIDEVRADARTTLPRERRQELERIRQEGTPEERALATEELQRAEEINYGPGMAEGILSAIAVGLGTYGSSVTGGPNYALQIVNDNTKRRIKQAQDERARRKGDVTAVLNDYDRFLKQFGSDEEAAAAMELQDLERFNSKIESIKSDLSSTEAMQNATVLQAEAQAKMGNLSAQLLQGEAAREQQRAMFRNQQRQTSLESGAVTPEQAHIEGLQATGKQIITKEDVKEVKKNRGKMESARNKVRELIKLREEYGSETLPGPTKSRMDALGNSILFDIAQMAGTGALQKADKEIVEDIVGKPTAYGFQMERLKTVQQIVDDHANNFYESHGYSTRFAPQTEQMAQ